MKICIHCGGTVADSSRFCEHCGREIPPGQTYMHGRGGPNYSSTTIPISTPPAPKNNSKIIATIIIAASVITAMLAVGITYLVATRSNRDKYDKIMSAVQFSEVCGNGTDMYAIAYFGTNGGIRMSDGDVSIKHIQELIGKKEEEMYVTSFCFYNNKLYFIGGLQGSVALRESIYECNSDGSGMNELTDKASNCSNVFILNDILYYDALSPRDAQESGDNQEKFKGGIYGINLDDGSEKKLISDYVGQADGRKRRRAYFRALRRRRQTEACRPGRAMPYSSRQRGLCVLR